MSNSSLKLGWKVNKNWDPIYWIKNDNPKPGLQSDDDLIRIDAGLLGHHTAIIAQSGSGKSFFLGRLIEEIILKTKARCVIFDPNSDFAKIKDVADEGLWINASYKNFKGKLPEESGRDVFSKLWEKFSIQVETQSEVLKGRHYKPANINWFNISADYFAEEMNPMHYSSFYHCHEFCSSLQLLTILQDNKPTKTIDLLFKEAEEILNKSNYQHEKLIHELDLYYQTKNLANSKFSKKHKFETNDITSAKSQTALYGSFITKDIASFYFSKAYEYFAKGVLVNKIDLSNYNEGIRSKYKIDVLDLPSIIDNKTKYLMINSILQDEWNNSYKLWQEALLQPSTEDHRSPVFLIIDEAHNLIPSNPKNSSEIALLSLFRKIIAEGRKYGLFLIIVSQRPDKLDPMVLSECENKVLMKLSSKNVLDFTTKMLNIENIAPGLINKCLELDSGRGILLGNWSPDGPQPFYCAARRTIEGGRDLQTSHWANNV